VCSLDEARVEDLGSKVDVPLLVVCDVFVCSRNIIIIANTFRPLMGIEDAKLEDARSDNGHNGNSHHTNRPLYSLRA
jgi:hypothetical protein